MPDEEINLLLRMVTIKAARVQSVFQNGAFARHFFMLTTTLAYLAAPAQAQDSKSFSGNVSWYGAQFNGKKTASGELFDMHKPTAAHLKLPFKTKVLVEDPKTGNSVVVKVNDRGPFVKTRVMDLSREGARRLGTLSKGVCYVDCTVLQN
jgi:rare lipoprotein A